MAQQTKYDYIFHILFTGARRVGKSSLQCRFATGTLPTDYLEFIRPEFLITTLNINGKTVKLLLWEPINDGRFRPIQRNNHKKMQGFILIYDISYRESFKEIENLLKDIEKDGHESAVKMLIGNKCDLESRRQVSYEEGKEYADKLGIAFMEVSAKSGINVQYALDSRVKELIDKAEGVERSNDEGIKKIVKEDKGKMSFVEMAAAAFRHFIMLLSILFIVYFFTKMSFTD